MKIEKGKRVRIRVRLQVKGGDELEKSTVEYFHGAGSMLLGLEKAIDGLEPGAKKKGTIKAAEAFGDPAKQPRKTMKRTEFPADAKLAEGARFEAKDADKKQDVVLQVVRADDKEVEVQLMHPLADKDIEYDVEVLAVTDPTPPPLPVDALELEAES